MKEESELVDGRSTAAAEAALKEKNNSWNKCIDDRASKRRTKSQFASGRSWAVWPDWAIF